MAKPPIYRIHCVSQPGAQAPDAVGDLDRRIFPKDKPEPLDGRYWWLVYRCDKTGEFPVAYAGMRVEREGFAFLCRAGVLMAHRGRGLHKRLIRCRIQAAKRLGLKGLITYTVPGNVRSANSLVAMGFKHYSPEWRWAGKEMLYFQLEF